ncbi:maleylpyruvate isomerase N-terminal domain-containing protein [Actinophytocola xanthii]|uniref:Mycothiol-dependent maleylpyruvate isomerase metal-binding domain-containing protein n=1 Tax=Actinophytocola xanthii TaxID=1912961 RepID=A0A1Q8CR92_9PSEU|nr:maleylpyruvate isomerase N-terminal domain-containing protein [Actinophytocola xanthii]OLF16857.1 hypothetical protein BU204_14190 [Actinophytocola xanthii]
MTGRALADYGRLLEVLDVEGDLLASSAGGADPALAVPNAPGMTLGGTVRHVGSVYRMVVAWVRAGGHQPTRWQRAPEDGQTLEDYLRTGHRALVEQLAEHDPEEACSTWWPLHQAYGFWYRRMAHESTIHRIDVQQAAAGMTVGAISEDVALDGVDEILSLWFTHRLGVLGVANSWRGQVAVVAGGQQWIASMSAGGTSAWRAGEDEIEGVDASVTSDPTGMFLWLWGRRPIRAVTPAGDRAGIAQLWHLLRLATH